MLNLIFLFLRILLHWIWLSITIAQLKLSNTNQPSRFVLPLLQSYVCAGDFSVVGKLKRAAIENAIYYGSITVVFIVLLIYVAADPHIHINIGGG